MKLTSRFFVASAVGALMCAVLSRTGLPQVSMKLGEATIPVVTANSSEGVQVSISWDAKTAEVVRKFGTAPVKSDEGLQDLLTLTLDNFKKQKKTDVVVSIDSTDDVPWKELRKVIQLCRKTGWKKIEFVVK